MVGRQDKTCTLLLTAVPGVRGDTVAPGSPEEEEAHYEAGRVEVKAGQELPRPLSLHPVGSSWINQIETWFGMLTRQSIRRGIFANVNVLITPDPQLHRLLELRGQALHLDRDRRRDPGEGPPRPDQHQETRRKQLKVTQTGSPDTSLRDQR